MSFSSGVKEELSRQISPARHCRIAEIAAIISLCGKVQIGYAVISCGVFKDIITVIKTGNSVRNRMIAKSTISTDCAATPLIPFFRVFRRAISGIGFLSYKISFVILPSSLHLLFLRAEIEHHHHAQESKQ